MTFVHSGTSTRAKAMYNLLPSAPINPDREVLTAFADDETSMFMHECEEFGTELR